ncbi:MAG TPA: radical SAM protein, partial [Desulfomonilaceae bacterium]|nr:radical SAM protein [Desulfomonilaceae bacterium]
MPNDNREDFQRSKLVQNKRGGLSAGSLWRNLVRGFAGIGRSEVFRSKKDEKRRWRLVQVESALECNIRCVMCPWQEFRANARERAIMRSEVWESIRAHLKEIQSVDFTGGGEPLLQPLLAEWVQDAKSAGCETGVLTNGLLLRKETAKRLIDAGLDWICVSIDAADKAEYESIRSRASLDIVCENLANLIRMRTNDVPMVMINFVMMSDNIHQFEAIVNLAAQLGVDQVNFKHCDVIRSNQGKGLGLFASASTKETRRFEKVLEKARSRAKKLRVRTAAGTFTPAEKPVCEQDPTDSVFITYDGTAAPCICLAYGGQTTFLSQDVIMPSIHYGRLPEMGLMEVWESENCVRLRKCFRDR